MLASLVIPTHNRPDTLAETMRRLDKLLVHADAGVQGQIEVIVVDNGSDESAEPAELASGDVPVRTIRLEENRGAAGRNAGAEAAAGEWIVMLDDDSAPTDLGFVDVLREAEADVAAVGASITTPSGKREMGGLPEVIVGCGAAIRRDAFLRAGGYDASFGYYAEEYDLCAQLILQGRRIVHDLRFAVLHRRSETGRDRARIMERITRNSLWVMSRYAPSSLVTTEIECELERRRSIAKRDGLEAAFDRAARAFEKSVSDQPRREMSGEQWDRFTGHRAASEHLGRLAREHGWSAAEIVDRGKNARVIERVLAEIGVCTGSGPDVRIAGTLSPGPMLDAMSRGGVHGAWEPRGMTHANACGTGAAAG